MKHIMGNSPKCKECAFFTEKSAEENGDFDGWCERGLKLFSRKINGRCKVHWNDNCYEWEDAENHMTSYEVQTLKPEPKRTPLERIWLEEEFKKHPLYEFCRDFDKRHGVPEV